MVNYQNGKIYKIINYVNENIYVGSTVKRLCNRMAHHRDLARNNNTTKLYQHMREIGIENFKIVLIENYSCNSKEELLSKEDEYIRTLKPELNMVNAVKNEEKFKETQKRLRKEYYENNKEKEKIAKKVWNANNKEKLRIQKRANYHKKSSNEKEILNEKKRLYYEQNKETISQHNKEYSKLHKTHLYSIQVEKRKIKEHCICGLIYSKCRRSEHNKTQRHTDFMEQHNMWFKNATNKFKQNCNDIETLLSQIKSFIH